MTADRILADLEHLWAELGRDKEGDVVRACTLTLIVLSPEDDDAAAVAGTVAELMREHPNRAIVIRLRTSSSAFEHRVVADCWKPFGGGEQICSERIEIECPAGAATELVPLLLGLEAADLPTVIWSRSPETHAAAGALAAALGASRVIVDSDGGGAPSGTGARIADLAWTRITPLREAAAACPADRVRDARIFHPGDGPTPSARYLAAWLKIPYAFQAADTLGIELRDQSGRVIESVREPRRSDAALLAEELCVEGRDPAFDAALETMEVR